MSRYDRPSHRVFMYFHFRDGWNVQFLEADLRTPLPRTLTFTDPDKVRELARRCEAWGDSESRQMLEARDRDGKGRGVLEAHAGAVCTAYAGRKEQA
jgi:hypothetical protein